MAFVAEKPAGEKGPPREVGGEVHAAAGEGGDDDMGQVSSPCSGGSAEGRVGVAWRQGEESVTTDVATVALLWQKWGGGNGHGLVTSSK